MGWRLAVCLLGLLAGACADESSATTEWMPFNPIEDGEVPFECATEGSASPFAWSAASIRFTACDGVGGPRVSTVSFSVQNSSARSVTLKWVEAEGESRALEDPLTLAPNEGALVLCFGGFTYPGDQMVACRPITVAWVDTVAPGTPHGAHFVARGSTSTMFDGCDGTEIPMNCKTIKNDAQASDGTGN